MFTFLVAVGETREGVPFIAIERIAFGLLAIFGVEHVFEISDLLSVLSELDILQVLHSLLGKHEVVFALLVSNRHFFLEALHLLDEDLLVPQPLLKYQVLLPLTLQLELEKRLVFLLAALSCDPVVRCQQQRFVVIPA
jgi:hypothetical protein